MKKYLPSAHELRQAVFTALVLLIIVGILGLAKHIKRESYENWQDNTQNNMGEMMMNMSMGLDGLTGANLEKTFLEEMIMHHEGVIDMAKTLKAGTKRPELLKMADDIITAQTKEVSQMGDWLDTWFPDSSQNIK